MQNLSQTLQEIMKFACFFRNSIQQAQETPIMDNTTGSSSNLLQKD